ncbi:hypothetical protein CL630_02455 [bacterium]|nr:hypothetical protein [bacterium]
MIYLLWFFVSTDGRKNMATTTETKFRKFMELVKLAVAIRDSDASWGFKYDTIFSDEVSMKIAKIGMTPNYCDPDASSENDVRAFVGALEEKAKNIRAVLDKLDEKEVQD